MRNHKFTLWVHWASYVLSCACAAVDHVTVVAWRQCPTRTRADDKHFLIDESPAGGALDLPIPLLTFRRLLSRSTSLWIVAPNVGSAQTVTLIKMNGNHKFHTLTKNWRSFFGNFILSGDFIETDYWSDAQILVVPFHEVKGRVKVQK